MEGVNEEDALVVVLLEAGGVAERGPWVEATYNPTPVTTASMATTSKATRPRPRLSKGIRL
ncbi:MAG TPA: hypothetical protein VEJ87_09160 [Acidimicrobiales bacterium]|nr:hypothetical protein [Acidimicrobiales bacterium]